MKISYNLCALLLSVFGIIIFIMIIFSSPTSDRATKLNSYAIKKEKK